MKKQKVTRTDVKRFYGNIIQVGYCGAQTLLRYREPWAYNCGIYGWNYDVYDVDGIRIVTGYRNMTGKAANYEQLEKYENAAREISADYSLTYDERKEKIESLLHEFCVENGGI